MPNYKVQLERWGTKAMTTTNVRTPKKSPGNECPFQSPRLTPPFDWKNQLVHWTVQSLASPYFVNNNFRWAPSELAFVTWYDSTFPAPFWGKEHCHGWQYPNYTHFGLQACLACTGFVGWTGKNTRHTCWLGIHAYSARYSAEGPQHGGNDRASNVLALVIPCGSKHSAQVATHGLSIHSWMRILWDSWKDSAEYHFKGGLLLFKKNQENLCLTHPSCRVCLLQWCRMVQKEWAEKKTKSSWARTWNPEDFPHQVEITSMEVATIDGDDQSKIPAMKKELGVNIPAKHRSYATSMFSLGKC